jgi:dUTP pyrophosphatase
MEREEIEKYISQLKEFEKGLTSEDDNDDDFDPSFINELDNLLGKLSSDIQKTSYQTSSNKSDNADSTFDVNVKVKKLVPEAVIPSYSKAGDAGMDLTITREIENTSFSVTYGFGIAMEIPKNYVGLVFPRSSVRNQDLILSNCVGVIDSGYRGELQATFKKTNGLDSLKYKVGERGAQIVIIFHPNINMIESDELSNTDRGTGGFGSTGN